MTSLRQSNSILWALAPRWITGCLPQALESGWTVEVTPAAINFRHPEREDEFPIPLPLPTEPADQVSLQRELHMRLPFVGPTGLAGTQPHRGPLVRDLLE